MSRRKLRENNKIIIYSLIRTPIKEGHATYISTNSSSTCACLSSSTSNTVSTMQFSTIAAAALLSLASSAFADPQCNQGGSFFSCADAQTACNTVTQNPISFSAGATSKQIGGFGSAQVWLTRAASSKTTDNCNALCNQIVASCCPSGGFGQKSTVALQAGEQGSVQIIPAN
ncbi:hypothetical protein SCHPADRAFT_282070 [Schizopora paradoxa]|uniref:Uncharacterized protein n=1 Tax=Schizopora paradoxa TaxID=27342 RepID=A0A0H2RTH7_9AGAM|nr:hypothetical protein SCHPADRAFT_282070 [Schizopora paradoxa]